MRNDINTRLPIKMNNIIFADLKWLEYNVHHTQIMLVYDSEFTLIKQYRIKGERSLVILRPFLRTYGGNENVQTPYHGP